MDRTVGLLAVTVRTDTSLDLGGSGHGLMSHLTPPNCCRGVQWGFRGLRKPSPYFPMCRDCGWPMDVCVCG